MRSVTFQNFGEPSGVLQVTDRPIPETGRGQVRLRMIMSPIHNHDLMVVRGVYGLKPPLPAFPGTEALGIVDAVGPEVTSVVPGQRVSVLGGSGAWSELIVTAAAGVVALPDTVPDETACQLVAMPLSAMMLLDDLQIQPGQWMIQNAANGVVGRMVARLAVSRGVQVVNLVRRDSAVAELAVDGIDHAISTESDGWQERVRETTSGEPITRGIDSIGGEATDAILDIMADASLLMSFGALSGKPSVISSRNLLFKAATVQGFWAAKRTRPVDPALRGRMIGDLIAQAAEGRLRLPVDATFDLSQAGLAAAASDTPGRLGKIVLTAQARS